MINNTTELVLNSFHKENYGSIIFVDKLCASILTTDQWYYAIAPHNGKIKRADDWWFYVHSKSSSYFWRWTCRWLTWRIKKKYFKIFNNASKECIILLGSYMWWSSDRNLAIYFEKFWKTRAPTMIQKTSNNILKIIYYTEY